MPIVKARHLDKESTNIRLNGVNPEREQLTVPILKERILKGEKGTLLVRGEILVPELLAKGMNVNIFYKNHADRHCSGEYHECDDDGCL